MFNKTHKPPDESYVIDLIRQEIVTENLKVKAIIQNIYACKGPREVLDELNSEGRSKIAILRKQITKLETLAKESDNEKTKREILSDVANYKDELTSTLAAFRKANITCLLSIERSSREELLGDSSEEASLRHRQRKDKESLVKLSTDVTEQLLSISRALAETTKHSAETLDTLATSSSVVHSTHEELHTLGSVINQSGKLLSKYGQREFTDKILIFFAFGFFVACAVYVVLKRLF
ncbi:vesicle transport protein SEC20 isoform X1 [Schistocerca nitens]|uniref:vesicle transport protein SEC20 isoform X1 n=1 Tax=Schistocerca nitens TaxID=7011 RepID=UPI002118981A|nr:vesicle transport protein SEC20 isoform X1 [Schistocerca nitens]